MYLQPTTLPEAVRALAATGAVPLAGGTDLFPAHVDRPPPPRLLDLSRVAGLRGIAADASGIRIGGLTTWTDVIRADLPPGLRALQEAAREVGSVQIQNRGTLAGNLCNASPAADGVPPLLAVDAEIELTSTEGARRLPLSAFVLGNRRTARRADELLTAIHLPPRPAREGSAFVKLGARRYLVISIVMVAARVALDARGRIAACGIAVGSASAAAIRLPTLEARLIGADPRTVEVTDGELAGLSPIDDVRATATYRIDAAAKLVGRAVALAAERAARG